MKREGLVRLAIQITAYLIAGFTILLSIALWRGFYNYERIYFSDAIEGTAWRPFVYRRLVPETARLVGQLTPEPVKQRVVQSVEKGMRPHGFLFVGERPEYQFEYFIAVLINLFALTGMGIFIHLSVKTIYGFSDNICFLIALASYFGLMPILFHYGPYFYDPLTLFTFSMAIYALLTKKRTIYYIAFLLALLNKETSLVLPFLFLITFWNSGALRWQLGIEAGLQLAAWGAWRFYLNSVYANNPGDVVEFHLLEYNARFFSSFGIRQIRFWVIGLVALYLVVADWRLKDSGLKKMITVMLIFFTPLHVSFALIDEFRGLLELYPVVFLLAIPTLNRLLRETSVHKAA